MEVECTPTLSKAEQQYSFIDKVQAKIESTPLNFDKLNQRRSLRRKIRSKNRPEQGLLISGLSLASQEEQGLGEKSNSIGLLPQLTHNEELPTGAIQRSSKATRNLFGMLD
mmetsp:Transcript_829/g.704  ORF Transcript_829/g.704 Transcript_829/m.704 type:complete len:111 (+) Transcript_829:38-370(+)